MEEAHTETPAERTVTTHGGLEIIASDDFFVDPPPELGDIITAQTDLQDFQHPISHTRRALIVSFWGASLLGIALLFVHFTHIAFFSFWFWAVILGLPATASLIAYYATRFKATCSFVGEGGIARFTLTKSRENPARRELVCFAEADALKTQTTNHFTNGVYQQTTYSFSWVTDMGATLFTISGTHRNRDGPPVDRLDPWYFADSARSAWNIFALSKMLTTLDAGGTVRFPMNRVAIQIGHDHFSLESARQNLNWSLSDLERVSLHQGYLTLTSAQFEEGGLFSRWMGRGKLTLPFHEIPNGELLLLLLEHVTKKPITTP